MNVLLVEDTEETLAFLEDALKEEGYVVDTAKDGNTGFRKALSNDYDLIILDNMLPGKTGREICSQVREKGKHSKILMLSVESSAENKADALDLGADDYMGKPFSLRELQSRLRALLRRPEKRTGDVFSARKVRLCSSSKKVTWNRKEVPLTPREFRILEYLFRNRGRTVPRTEILEHAFDLNADPFTNTVEVHIMHLRKKIPEKSFIHTVAGTGYRID